MSIKTSNPRNIHDITFRGILRHSNELANLLNTELELTEPISPNNIKYIDAQFITDGFHSKDSDLICEVENKDNIFLIEHQSTVNSIMPIRVLNYTKELVKEISQGERCNKAITPIIVYTGSDKWTAEKYIGEFNQKILAKNNIKIGEYILLDMNRYLDNDLLNKKGAFYKTVLLDRFIYDRENLLKVMDMIQLLTLDKSEQRILLNYANGLLLSIVSEDRIKEFVKNIVDEESDEGMFLLPERVKIWYNEDIAKATNDGISKGIAKGKAEGRAEGMAKGRTNELLKLAKKMIKDNLDIELIKRYTGYSTKQIEELKKSMS